MDYRYIYILFSPRYPFRYKIGIAYNVQKRISEINKTMQGTTYEIFSIRIHFAEFFEGCFHVLYFFLNAKMSKKYSGYTEWFWFVFPFTPIILLWCLFLIQRFFVFVVVMLLCYVLAK